MVSTKNKRRLKDAASKTGELVTKAGRAYMNYSDKAVKGLSKKLKEQAEAEKKKADEVVGNAEPNDPEDVRLYREVERNHKQVMAQLRNIENSIDELARPMDEQPGAPMVEQGSTDDQDWMEDFRL